MSGIGEAKRMVDSGETVRGIRDIRAMILLAGSLRATDLLDAIDRSVLDLPLEQDLRILDFWCDQARELAGALGVDNLGMRLIIDGSSHLPEVRSSEGGISVEPERDPLEFRGTAGVLADVCADYDPDDVVIVANASQLPLYPLVEQAAEMSAEEADVCLLSSFDGTPCGMWMLRCGVLADVPKVGFIDFKEQALPRIAKDHRVQVIHRERPTGPSVRTLDGYIRTVRGYHIARESGSQAAWDPFAEDWRPVFSIVEEGAEVDSSAGIFDSVVLAGARVSAKASVIRSVVGPGGSIGRGGQLIVGARGGSGEARRRSAGVGGN